MPKNVQTLACDPVVASTMETVDWCEKAQEADCNLVTSVETGDLQGIQEAINDIVSSQWNERSSWIYWEKNVMSIYSVRWKFIRTTIDRKKRTAKKRITVSNRSITGWNGKFIKFCL